MNNYLNLFIARRISSSPKSRAERVMVSIAITSIAISIATIIIAINIVEGFKGQISDKVVGFASHYTLTSLSADGEETLPAKTPFTDELLALPYVKSVDGFISKGGIMRNDSTVVGILYKGVGCRYNLSFFEQNIVEGRLPNLCGEEKSKEVMVSQSIASRMGIKVGDRVQVSFLSSSIFNDRLTVCAIYNSAFSEFDSKLIVGDIRNLSRLLSQDENLVSGFEVKIDNLENVDLFHPEVEKTIYDNLADYPPVQVKAVTQEYMQIFDWLELQNVNIVVVITIMIFVAAFNMVAMMLILLIGKSSMIGTLKALGLGDRGVQAIFLMRSSYILGAGIAIGLLLGLGLSLIQLHFKVLTLSADGYFLSYVPIQINYLYICAIALLTFVVLILLEMIPVGIISKISPGKSIKFN